MRMTEYRMASLAVLCNDENETAVQGLTAARRRLPDDSVEGRRHDVVRGDVVSMCEDICVVCVSRTLRAGAMSRDLRGSGTCMKTAATWRKRNIMERNAQASSHQYRSRLR